MDRETVLKHSRAVRLEHRVLSDFTDLVNEFCTIKGHPEYVSNIISLLQNYLVNEHIINAVLEYFEKEFYIIKIEKFPNIGTLTYKQLINII